MVEIDREFPKKWPFGVLMTMEWIICFALLITLYCSPYRYSGTSFVLFCGWTMFLVYLLVWFAHMLSFNRQTFSVGQASFFIPFALIIFGYSLIFFFLFCISGLICMVSMFSSFGYGPTLFFVYLLATVFCLLCAAGCGYISILLYRGTPNGYLLNLRTVIIEGDKTSTFGTTTVPAGNMPTAGFAPSNNPV